jgi:DNA-binding transcriptional LysR family regulator
LSRTFTLIVARILAAADTQHRCINLRFVSSDGVYAWEFEKDGRQLRTKVGGQLVFNRTQLVLRAALAGHGLGYLIEDSIRPFLDDGSLVQVLDDWCAPFDGHHLYYATRRQASPAFRLLVDALRYRG